MSHAFRPGNPENSHDRDPFKTRDELESFQQYLKELRTHSLMSPEEERECAIAARNGCEHSVTKLVSANLRFVISVAKKYKGRGVSYPDLVAEGNMGLVRAARNFDPEQEVRFLTYAVYWIRNYILDALSRQGRFARIPHNRASQVNNLEHKTKDLRMQLGREPTDHELAEATGDELDEVRSLRHLTRRPVDFDAPVRGADGESTSTWRDRIADPNLLGLENEVEVKQCREMLENALRALPQRDADLLRKYYGLGDQEPMTLAEIADIFGVTRQRVGQLHNRALKKLRDGEEGTGLRVFL